jgi:hypothetical protein
MFIESHYGAFIVHQHRRDWNGCQSPDCERSELVQTDWDYPATAESLGWSLRKVQKPGRRRKNKCDHRSTDGTVDCSDCGITASEFISAAGEYLDSIAE